MSTIVQRAAVSLVVAVLVCQSGASPPPRPVVDANALARRYDLEFVTASPDFPVALKTGTIAGAEAPKTAVDSYLALFAGEWSLYPPDLVRRSRLKKVVFCRNLAFENQPRTGIPDFEHDALYLDVTRGRHSELYVRKVIHHEFFHIIDLRDDGQLYEDERWARLNPPGFKYGPGGVRLQDDPTVTVTGKEAPGFLNRYGMSGVEEDKAELFAHMMVEPEVVADRARRDAYVRAKVERMRELLEQFSPRMDAAFWKTVERKEPK